MNARVAHLIWTVAPAVISMVILSGRPANYCAADLSVCAAHDIAYNQLKTSNAATPRVYRSELPKPVRSRHPEQLARPSSCREMRSGLEERRSAT
jgi:hypothetical protein